MKNLFLLTMLLAFIVSCSTQTQEKMDYPDTMMTDGAETPVSKTIEQYADIFGFTLFSMGIDELK